MSREINCTIGKWWDGSLAIKQSMVEFMLEEWRKKIPQMGSIKYGETHQNHPRFWEYATAIYHSQPKGKEILDVGGLNNLMGWYLHNRMDCFVIQLGLNLKDERNFVENLPQGQSLKINGLRIDIREAPYKEAFDIVYCINVIEHIRPLARRDNPPAGWKFGRSSYWDKTEADWEQEEKSENIFVKALVDAVKPGGLLVISYDFISQGEWKCQAKCAYMRDAEDVIERIVKPSKLNLIGKIDENIYPRGNIQPNCSTGIVFLKK